MRMRSRVARCADSLLRSAPSLGKNHPLRRPCARLILAQVTKEGISIPSPRLSIETAAVDLRLPAVPTGVQTRSQHKPSTRGHAWVTSRKRVERRCRSPRLALASPLPQGTVSRHKRDGGGGTFLPNGQRVRKSQ